MPQPTLTARWGECFQRRPAAGSTGLLHPGHGAVRPGNGRHPFPAAVHRSGVDPARRPLHLHRQLRPVRQRLLLEQGDPPWHRLPALFADGSGREVARGETVLLRELLKVLRTMRVTSGWLKLVAERALPAKRLYGKREETSAPQQARSLGENVCKRSEIGEDIGRRDHIVVLRGLVTDKGHDVPAGQAIVASAQAGLRQHPLREIDASQPICQRTDRGTDETRAATQVQHVETRGGSSQRRDFGDHLFGDAVFKVIDQV